jgi:hypothetical protein
MTAYIQQKYPNAFPTTRFAATSEISVNSQESSSRREESMRA